MTDQLKAEPDTSQAALAPPDPRRWLALAVIAIAQLMLVLDATIVNVALPSLTGALGISQVDQQWVVTAYTLSFGSLLLFAGRIADFTGRKRAFIIGLLGFAAASALGGFANTPSVLFAARALQGAFGALMAPAALSLLAVTFTDPKERARAFGVFGAIAGAGSAIGLILGGVLTEFASWRWTLGVNVPVAVLAVVAALFFVRESRAPGVARYDIPGILLASGGLFSLVYGFTVAAEPSRGWDDQRSWTDPLTLLMLGAAVVLLVAFVVVERSVANPLLPLRVVLDRNRAGAYLTFLLVGAGLFAMFLFLTLYYQQQLGYSPLRTGFAFLPFSGTIILMAAVVAQLLPRTGPRPLMVSGLVLAATGMILLTRLDLDSSYVVDIMPPQIIMGIGMSLVFIPASSTALFNVDPRDTGVASATLNTAQQIGGAIGTALLTTVYANAFTAFLTKNPTTESGPPPAEAFISGYHHAFAWGAGALVLALLVSAVLVNARPTSGRGSEAAVPV